MVTNDKVGLLVLQYLKVIYTVDYIGEKFKK